MMRRNVVMTLALVVLEYWAVWQSWLHCLPLLLDFTSSSLLSELISMELETSEVSHVKITYFVILVYSFFVMQHFFIAIFN